MLPIVSSIPRICDMNIAATASYKAVPSMFMAEPIGSMNFATFSSTSLFSIIHFSVIGKDAEL